MDQAIGRVRSAERTRLVAFIAVMGASGNVLSWISMLAAPFTPTIPLGPYSVSVALDLSHVATFIAALYGGPVLGGLTGLVGGLAAAFQFGFSKGNLVTGFGLPLGKALTGVFSGVLLNSMGVRRRTRGRVVVAAIAVLAYIPEAVYTAFIFLVVFPLVFATPSFVLIPITATILIKAFIELIIVGILVCGLCGNKGFNLFLGRSAGVTAGQGVSRR